MRHHDLLERRRDGRDFLDLQATHGEHVREPVDALLRDLLVAHRLPWAVIGGAGPARLQQAVDAVTPLLRRR